MIVMVIVMDILSLALLHLLLGDSWEMKDMRGDLNI